MVVARSLQGAISQFAWSVGLALAVSLPPIAGVAATAWAMTGNSVGEVRSPQICQYLPASAYTSLWAMAGSPVGEVRSARCALLAQTPPQTQPSPSP